jgi:hypothetical protein
MHRQNAIDTFNRIKEKSKSNLPLSGDELRELNNGTKILMDERKALLDLALKYESWTINSPNTNKEAQQIGVSISVASALMLYDNYLLAISLFYNDDKLRKAINTQNSTLGLSSRELDEISYSYFSIDKRDRIKRAIDWFEANKHNQIDIPEYEYISEFIQQSPSYNSLQNPNTIYLFGKKFEFFTSFGIGALRDIKNSSTYIISMLFGNTTGLVESRKGKLYRDKRAKDNILKLLQPGDILLEKTPFRLTDKLIPGFWGHAALWIGRENELKVLGIWDDKTIVPHHEKIKKEKMIIEALRSGVVINSLDHFLNIDDFAIIRECNATNERKKRVISEAFLHVGKPYDFNFDTQNTKHIFCSELIYQTYGDKQWPTSKMLGTITVSPDDIAKYTIKNNDFELITLYRNGSIVDKDLKPRLSKMMEE